MSISKDLKAWLRHAGGDGVGSPDRGPEFGGWAAITLFLVVGAVCWANLARLENPVREKYVPLFPPGQLDFSYTYLAAQALRAGVNPYHNDRPEFSHPIFPPEEHGGFKHVYPPGNLLIHVPLVLWKGSDAAAAGRIWFRASLVALALLSVIVWRLARRIQAAPVAAVWIPLFAVCLSMNTGVELGLERGQSDIPMALLIWAGVASFLANRTGVALFLVVLSVAIKGYSLPLAVGLALLSLNRRRWRPALIGSVLATATVIVPTFRYLPEAIQAIRLRSDLFWPVWYNHGFVSAIHFLAPTWAPKGRMVLTAIAVVVAIAAWIKSRQAAKADEPDRFALWLTVFATAALGTPIGYSALSISYNLILMLPGVLVLVACQRRLLASVALGDAAEHIIGAAWLVSVFLLFTFRWGGGGAEPVTGEGAPASAFGLVAWFLTLAGVLGWTIKRSLAERRADRAA